MSAVLWATMIECGSLVGKCDGGLGFGLVLALDPEGREYEEGDVSGGGPMGSGGRHGGKWMSCTWPVWRPGTARRVA